MNTDRVYKQKKFNLYREESEGYSKTLTLFSSLNKSNVEYTLRKTKSIIGTNVVEERKATRGFGVKGTGVEYYNYGR